MTGDFVNSLKLNYPLSFEVLNRDQLALKRIEQKLSQENLPLEWFPSVLKESKYPQNIIQLAWSEHLIKRAKETGEFQRIQLTEKISELSVLAGEYLIMPTGEWLALSDEEIMILEALEEEIQWTEDFLLHELSLNTGKEKQQWKKILKELEHKLKTDLIKE